VELDVDSEAALGALEGHLDVHLAHPGEGSPPCAVAAPASDPPPRGATAVATFSSSPLTFGVTAKLMTGSGRNERWVDLHLPVGRRSPVWTFFNSGDGTVSPRKLPRGRRRLPEREQPTRTFECSRWSTSVVSS
jgi:hypothetical protein